MIINARLTQRIAAPTPDGRGGQAAGATTTLDIPCCFASIRLATKMRLDAKLADATAVAYVPKPSTGVTSFARREVLTFVQGEETHGGLELLEFEIFEHESQSHWVLYLQGR